MNPEAQTIDQMAQEAHDLAIAQGWWNDKSELETIARCVANLHGELSEYWESYRNNSLNKPCDKADNMMKHGIEVLTSEEEELADFFIRAMDLSKKREINIGRVIAIKHEYNKTRAFRHGNKLA